MKCDLGIRTVEDGVWLRSVHLTCPTQLPCLLSHDPANCQTRDLKMLGQ
jgi:hypothetical protein